VMWNMAFRILTVSQEFLRRRCALIHQFWWILLLGKILSWIFLDSSRLWYIFSWGIAHWQVWSWSTSIGARNCIIDLMVILQILVLQFEWADYRLAFRQIYISFRRTKFALLNFWLDSKSIATLLIGQFWLWLNLRLDTWVGHWL
jgi:hypothetical protein